MNADDRLAATRAMSIGVDLEAIPKRSYYLR